MSLKAKFHTLGCRLNQSESAIIANQLKKDGYQIVEEDNDVDLCVINTCTVTHQSDAKCRQTIRSLQRKNPKAQIAVIGCFSQMASEQIKEIGGIDYILGTQNKLKLPRYLKERKNNDEPLIDIDDISKESFKIHSFGQSSTTTRANLKVQDGCDFFCSFCIIPFARGRSRSRDFQNIKDEAIKLTEQGYKEVILTGVNVGTYDDKGKDFFDVVEMLNKLEGIKRIRVSSIEPTTVGEKLFSLMSDTSHKLLPYLHLPLQSASDIVLKDMRRKYTFSEYQDFLLKAYEMVPNIGLGTDVLTGFPTEDDVCFDETLKRLKSLPLHYFHVFPYSDREGTQSIKYSSKNSPQVLARRVEVLRNLSDQKKEGFIQSNINTVQKVLFEESKNGEWLGYSENYIRISLPSKDNLKNQILKVRIKECREFEALAELI